MCFLPKWSQNGSIGKKNTSTDSAKKRKVNASKRPYREGKIRIEFWVSPETKEQWERMKANAYAC